MWTRRPIWTWAANIIYNAKCSRPSVCNAIETILVHQNVAEEALPTIQARLDEKQVELRGCEKAQAILPGIPPATEEDWPQSIWTTSWR